MAPIPLETLAAQVVKCSNHAGNHPPWDKLAAWSVELVYLNAQDDPNVTPALVEECAREHTLANGTRVPGVAVGLYFIVPRDQHASSAAAYAAGQAFARRCSARVTELGGTTRIAAVMFDNEKAPLDFQRGLCDEWDRLRPFRPTLWSVEPIQDGTQNDYNKMLRRAGAAPGSRRVTIQCYGGGMQPYRPIDCVDYLTVRGVPRELLNVTLDPAQPAATVAQGYAAGTKGAVLFETGRMAA
jgi:hypothetical protein